MLMPQLITWTEKTGNILINVPKKHWKTSTFLFFMNIWASKMMYIPAELLKKLPYVLVLGIKLLKSLPWKHTASYDWLLTGEKFLESMYNWKPGLQLERKQENWLVPIFSETTLSNFHLCEFITKYIYKQTEELTYRMIMRYILFKGISVIDGK